MEIRSQSKTGSRVPSPLDLTASLRAQLDPLSQQWVDRLAQDPARFADVEVEIHDRFRRLADQMTASVLATATVANDRAGPGKKGGPRPPTAPDGPPRNARGSSACSGA